MGKNLAEDLTGGDFPVTHGCQQVVVACKTEFGSDSLEITALLDLLKIDGIFPEILFTYLTTQNDTSRPFLGLDPGADLVAGAGTLDDLEPVLAGGMVRRCD